MKRTDMKTYQYDRYRRVYQDEDGKLYYRMNNQWHGTFREYCDSPEDLIEKYTNYQPPLLKKII